MCGSEHQGWIEQHRYLNMELLKEHRKTKLEVKAAWSRRPGVAGAGITGPEPVVPFFAEESVHN